MTIAVKPAAWPATLPHLVTKVPGPKAPPTDRTDVQGLRPPVPRGRAQMERIADLAVKGAVKPPEVKLFKLSDAAEAQKISEGRHFRGKLVFKIR